MADKSGCTSLEDILNMYEATPWNGLSQYISALTGTAVGLFILSVGSLAVPRRLAPRAFLAALLVFQILILIPYFILDSRRNSMIFKDIRSSDELKAKAADCKFPDKVRNDHNFYRFKGNGRSVWFEGFALIASSCISGVLASRLVYLSVLRSFNGDDSEDGRGRGRRRRRGSSERDLADIDALLQELRYTPSAPPDPDEKEDDDVQCAICLDKINLNPPKTIDDENDSAGTLENRSVTQLHCSHLYHENCLRNWFRSTRQRRYSCPMCKASVWADDDDDNGEEAVNGDEENGGVEGTGNIEAETHLEMEIDIDIEISAPASSGAAPEIVALTSTTAAQPQELESDDFVIIPLPRDGRHSLPRRNASKSRP